MFSNKKLVFNRSLTSELTEFSVWSLPLLWSTVLLFSRTLVLSCTLASSKVNCSLSSFSSSPSKLCPWLTSFHFRSDTGGLWALRFTLAQNVVYNTAFPPMLTVFSSFLLPQFTAWWTLSYCCCLLWDSLSNALVLLFPFEFCGKIHVSHVISTLWVSQLCAYMYWKLHSTFLQFYLLVNMPFAYCECLHQMVLWPSKIWGSLCGSYVKSTFYSTQNWSFLEHHLFSLCVFTKLTL